MDPINNKYIRDLPLWLKWVIAFVTILGVPSIFFSTWTGYESVSRSLQQQSLVATTTPNIADILSQYNHFDRAIEQQNFLKGYENTEVVGAASFINIRKIETNSNSYLVFGKVSKGFLASYFSPEYIACSFGDVDEVTNRRLNLLRSGMIFVFSGNFTAGTESFGTYAWYISGCHFIE